MKNISTIWFLTAVGLSAAPAFAAGAALSGGRAGAASADYGSGLHGASHSSALSTSDAQVSSSVAARVNGDSVLATDVDRMVAAVREHDTSLNGDSPEVKAALQTIRQRVINNLIERRLLVQEAERRGIVPQAAEVDAGMVDIRGPEISDADYARQLAGEGRTIADVRRFVGEELQVRELAKRLTANLNAASISEADVQKFYDANTDQWIIPASAKAHHILLLVKPDASESEKAAIRAHAVAIKKVALLPNTDFEALARLHSQEPGAKASGGALGEFVHDQMLKPFADAVFGSRAGQIVGPVETKYGYHIIRVDALTPGGQLPVDKVREGIVRFLLKQAMQASLDQQVQALKSTATIKEYS